MSHNKISKIVSIIATAIMLTNATVNPVMANDLFYNVQVTEEGFASDSSYNKLKSNHLNFGNIEITKLSSNEIGIYGLTQCHHMCSHIDLDIALEWKVNGSYSTYKMWEFDADNDTQLVRSLRVIVPKGHYYRIRGYHAAKDSGVKESTTTLTQGILVD